MAQKKTYIYRMLIGKHGDVMIDDCYVYARNAGQAIDFCKEHYRAEKYDYYQAIKIGRSHKLRETQFVDAYEAEKMARAGAESSEKFSERDNVVPELVNEIEKDLEL